MSLELGCLLVLGAIQRQMKTWSLGQGDLQPVGSMDFALWLQLLELR